MDVNNEGFFEPVEQEPVKILPDGSAFGVMSFPLPDDHWLYAPNEYKDGEYEPIDLPKPIFDSRIKRCGCSGCSLCGARSNNEGSGNRL